MKKADRIESFMRERLPGETSHERFFLGYFSLFNDQKYYEAHDVLEHLWLKTSDQSYQFFKGLIQLAGAFVHLKKQYQHPEHATHSRRLRPAYRLFLAAEQNLAPFTAGYLGFNVADAIQLCRDYGQHLIENQYRTNPWKPETAPRLPMPHPESLTKL